MRWVKEDLSKKNDVTENTKPVEDVLSMVYSNKEKNKITEP